MAVPLSGRRLAYVNTVREATRPPSRVEHGRRRPFISFAVRQILDETNLVVVDRVHVSVCVRERLTPLPRNRSADEMGLNPERT